MRSSTTVFFDNTGAESGITKAGVSSFKFQGASFSGGTVFVPSQSALLASGTQAYDVSSGTAEVDFSQPIGSLNFFYVHGFGFAAGTATAYAADGTTILGTVSSKAATTFGDPANFVTLGPFSQPIAKITFSGGVIDNFTFTTAANNQAYFVNLQAGQTAGSNDFGDQFIAGALEVEQLDADAHRVHGHVRLAAERERPEPLRLRGRLRCLPTPPSSAIRPASSTARWSSARTARPSRSSRPAASSRPTPTRSPSSAGRTPS